MHRCSLFQYGFFISFSLTCRKHSYFFTNPTSVIALPIFFLNWGLSLGTLKVCFVIQKLSLKRRYGFCFSFFPFLVYAFDTCLRNVFPPWGHKIFLVFLQVFTSSNFSMWRSGIEFYIFSPWIAKGPVHLINNLYFPAREPHVGHIFPNVLALFLNSHFVPFFLLTYALKTIFVILYF